MSLPMNSFGELLVALRKRAGMAQVDLAAAVGYSRSLISALEQNVRQPDVTVIVQCFLPALGLESEPQLAARLVELAATARGERPPANLVWPARPGHEVNRSVTLPTLPLPPTPLLGRADDLAAIANRLIHHSGRLMTLVGPPGVGKSRLALAVAQQTQTFFKDGAYFAPLAALTDPTLLVEVLAHTLQLVDGQQRPHAPRPPVTVAQIVQFLRHKTLLLVLDNFEQLLPSSLTPPQTNEGKNESDAVALVTLLLAECPELVVLATSRERLHLRAEQRYRVQPLPLAPAIQLFVQRAQAVAPEFALTAADETFIAEICRQLDCLPLALELVAAHADLLTPATLLARLREQRLNLLTDGPYDLPVQQRSLRSAIQHSYHLLNPEEQRAFRTLGVFVGGFEPDAALRLGVDEATLHRLVNKSMVMAVVTPRSRFVLLETLRTYALEQLALAGEQTTGQRRHAEYFLDLAEAREPYRFTADDQVWFARLHGNVENLQAAMRWMVHQQATEMAVRFAWALRSSWDTPLRLAIDEALVRQAVAVADQTWGQWIAAADAAIGPEQRRQLDLYAKALFALVDCAADYSEARQLCQRCLALNQITGPTELTPSLYCCLAAHAAWAGDFASTDRYNAACIAVTPTIPTLREPVQQSIIAHILSASSLSSLERGDFARCIETAEQSQRIFCTLDNQIGAANCLSYRGEALLHLGDPAHAHTLLIEALTTMQAWESIMGLLNVYRTLGMWAIDCEDWAQAHALLSKGIATLPLDNLPLYRSDLYHLLWWLAKVALHQQDPVRAAQLIGGASPLFELSGSIWFPPIYRPLYEQSEATARAQLDATTFNAAYVAGRTLTMEEIIGFVLAHFGSEQAT